MRNLVYLLQSMGDSQPREPLLQRSITGNAFSPVRAGSPAPITTTCNGFSVRAAAESRRFAVIVLIQRGTEYPGVSTYETR
jgi:hypothetical protein